MISGGQVSFVYILTFGAGVTKIENGFVTEPNNGSDVLTMTGRLPE